MHVFVITSFIYTLSDVYSITEKATPFPYILVFPNSLILCRRLKDRVMFRLKIFMSSISLIIALRHNKLLLTSCYRKLSLGIKSPEKMSDLLC